MNHSFLISGVAMVTKIILGACLAKNDNYKFIKEKNLQFLGIDIDKQYIDAMK